ncbi:MAG TPA: hypothetical protein VM847_18225 [Tahibacter sp.]|nr:hypothetical protein [Tahibacter sp.]
MGTIAPGFASRLRAGTGMLVAAAAALLPVPGAAADVAVSIHLDADFVDLVRGMRRADGRDPPDREADRRLAALLQRLRGSGADGLAASPVSATAPGAVRDLFCVARR